MITPTLADQDKHEKMLQFWSNRSREHGFDPRANTNDIHLRPLEIGYIAHWIDRERPRAVLDFGCANGYTTTKLAHQFPEVSFTGVDINADMIAVANESLRGSPLENLQFLCLDILKEPLASRYDLIFTIRVFQNMSSLDTQLAVADALIHTMRDGELLITLETYADAYKRLNSDRTQLGLPRLPDHPHLTMLTTEFDAHLQQRLQRLEYCSPTSSYYFITRLLYSAYAAQQGEPIDYDHPLHRLASQVPQIGHYGPQYAGVYRKSSRQTDGHAS